MNKLDRLLTYAAEGSRESPPSMPAIFPMQCSCGHIFLEKYQYHKPLTDGRIGFCWCGFCRKKTFVTDSSRQSAIIGNGGDSGSDAKPPRNTFQRGIIYMTPSEK